MHVRHFFDFTRLEETFAKETKKVCLWMLLLLVAIVMSSYCILTEQQKMDIEEFVFTDAPFKSCHASTIVETPGGLVTSWFGGTHEKNKDVEIWVSRKVNGIWTPPVSVADGIQHDNKRYPTWNPVLFQIPNGPLMLFYKVGPNPKEWWGMLVTSRDNGKTWSEPLRLPDDILGPIKNKPILLRDGTLICPSSTENSKWQVHFEITKDFGKSWSIIGPINDGEVYNVIQPSILFYGENRLQMLARSKENRLISCWSENNGKSWGKLIPTSLPNPNSGIDAVTLTNGWQLLVYNHTAKIEGEWGGPRSPLNVAVSQDGQNWKALMILEDQPGEYSYPAVIQAKDGMVHITYTWKRERIKHVALDPDKTNFENLANIVDGQWPK